MNNTIFSAFYKTHVNDDENTIYNSMKTIMTQTVTCLENRFNSRQIPDNFITTNFGPLKFHKGDLIILAAPHFMSKTNFVLNLINQSTIPCGFISIGTIDNHIIGQNLLLMNSDVSLSRIKSGMLREEDINKLCNAAHKLYNIPFYSSILPNCSLDDCLEKAKSLIKEKQIQLLIIDDFDFIEELIECEKENYKFYLEEILQSFKEFARNNNIPFLLTMELDSVMEDSELTLRDFNNKMTIPNIADMVLFEQIKRKFTKDDYYEAELKISKDLNGNTEGIILPMKYYAKGLFEIKKED